MKKYLQSSSMTTSSSTAATLPSTIIKSSTQSHRCFHFGIILMATSLAGILLLTIFYHSTSTINYKYSIAIDSGSTHSRVVLFRWKADKLNDTGLIEEIDSCRVNQPISTNDGSKVNMVADELFHCIRNITTNIKVKNENISIYLGATAGMRLLNQTEPNLVSRIFDQIRKKFQTSGMNIRRISIISGQEEGMFAWIAVNYLSGTLFNRIQMNNKSSFGILDMGGSSAQIARAVLLNEQNNRTIINNDDDGNYQQIRLFGNEYKIHTFSNLCFGAEQALFRYIRLLISRQSDKNGKINVPCFPIGYRTLSSKFPLYDNICTAMKSKSAIENNNEHNEYDLIGTGQLQQCQQDIEWLINREKCTENFEICFKEIPITTNDDDRQRQMDLFYYAISAYYHETKVLRFKKFENISRQQYLNEYHQMCSKTFDQLNEELRIDKKFTASMCFKLPYVISTLTNVYKFNDKTWSRLKFAQDVNKSYIGWVTGMMISETNQIPGERPWIRLINNEIFLAMIITFIMILIISAMIVFYGRKNHRKMVKQTQVHSTII
ncbi:ectonucleoside triphosphate diphosphohydrolase 1 [Dermatophagoides farinae]|uniref:ectonucleoside triphosphate diphosphohydrolase 1 n=1 Tax=Dermatophagoides farinae TaxID=6954 RepID=UPI003F61F88D